MAENTIEGMPMIWTHLLLKTPPVEDGEKLGKRFRIMI
jgi:hypothetical protein